MELCKITQPLLIAHALIHHFIQLSHFWLWHLLEVSITRRAALDYIPMHDINPLVHLHILETFTLEISHGDITVLISNDVWALTTGCITGCHLLVFLDFSSSASQDFWQLPVARNKMTIQQEIFVKITFCYDVSPIQFNLWNSIIQLFCH